MMIRLFGHYVSKLYLLLGGVEFLVMFYSLLAGFYMRLPPEEMNLAAMPETLSHTALAYASAMTIAMVSVGLYQRGLPFSAGLLVRLGLSFLIASVAMSAVFYTFPIWSSVVAPWRTRCCSPSSAFWGCAVCSSG